MQGFSKFLINFTVTPSLSCLQHVVLPNLWPSAMCLSLPGCSCVEPFVAYTLSPGSYCSVLLRRGPSFPLLTLLLTISPGLEIAWPPQGHLLVTEQLRNHFKAACVPQALAHPQCLILKSLRVNTSFPEIQQGQQTSDDMHLSFKPPLATN